MIGISHLLRRVSQVCVTIGALVQQLILTTVGVLFSEINRSLSNTGCPFPSPSVYDALVSTHSRLSLSPFFYRRLQPLARSTAKEQAATSRAIDSATRYRGSLRETHWNIQEIILSLHTRSSDASDGSKRERTILYHARKRKSRKYGCQFNGSRKIRVYCTIDDAVSSIRDSGLVGTCYDGEMAVGSDHSALTRNTPQVRTELYQRTAVRELPNGRTIIQALSG